MKSIILKWYDKLSFPPEWRMAVSSEAEKEIDFNRTDLTPMECLLKCLYKCEALQEFYKQKGISEEIFYHSLSDLPVWANNCYIVTGEYGINNWGWLWNHVEGNLFRLGRLQFTMSKFHKDYPELGVNEGELNIEVHIPQGEPLDIEASKESLRVAVKFFEKYFPEHRFKWFVSHTWLFDYELKNLLSPESNIIKFQNLFKVLEYNESDQTQRYLFTLNPDKEPKTTLQKKVLEHLEKGGKLHEGYGVILAKECSR